MGGQSFVSDSMANDIKLIKKKLQQLSDNQLYSPPQNTLSMMYDTLGQRNAAHGPQTGIESSQPLDHYVTDVDASGTHTGVYDKLVIISSNIIVDWLGNNAINLKSILKTPNDGTRIACLAVKQGKTLTLEPGDNIAITSNIILTDQDMVYLVYSEDIGNKYRILVSSTTGDATGLWSGITIDTDKDMLNYSLNDLHEILFHSTGAGIGFETSGDGKVLDFMVNGQVIATLSRNQLGFNPNQSVYEIIDTTSSGFPPTLKLAYLPSSPTADVYAGDLSFDSYDSSSNQVTFTKILGKTIAITAGAYIGEMQFWVADGTGLLAQVMNVEGGPFGSTPKGINLLGHSMYLIDSLSFDIVGSTIFEESDAMSFKILNSPGGQSKFRWYQDLTVIAELSQNEFKPYSSVFNIGDTTHFVSIGYFNNLNVGSADNIISKDIHNNMTFEIDSGSEYRWYINDVLEMYLDTGNTLHAPYLSADLGLIELAADFGLDPLGNGVFTRNGSDVKVFSGGAVRNLSQIAATLTSFITTGNYVTSLCVGNLGSASYPNNIYFIQPYIAGRQQVIDKIGIQLFSSGVHINLGIYSDNGSGYPGSLLFDSGDTIVSGSPESILISPNITLKAGNLYWLVYVCATNNVNAVNHPVGSMIPLFGSSAIGGTPYVGYTIAGVQGLLPNPFPSGANKTTGDMPAIFIHIASQN